MLFDTQIVFLLTLYVILRLFDQLKSLEFKHKLRRFHETEYMNLERLQDLIVTNCRSFFSVTESFKSFKIYIMLTVLLDMISLLYRPNIIPTKSNDNDVMDVMDVVIVHKILKKKSVEFDVFNNIQRH